MRPPFLLVLTVLAACGSRGDAPRTVQPGAPGEASREVTAGEAATREADRAGGYTAADVDFVQAMIPHHAQALVMTGLVPGRTESRDLRLLAERIEASQTAEIDQMREWLRARGEEVPPVAHERHGDTGAMGGMHGMATRAQLERLAASRDAAFDPLFLELMIRHHEGAILMTRDLLATEGGGLEPQLFQLISHIDADQRAEIARMRRMLEAPIDRGAP